MSEGSTSAQYRTADEFVLLGEYELTYEMNRLYVRGLEDSNPWYLEDSPFGGPIAHPAVLANRAMTLRIPLIESGGVHAAEETECINPARIGKKVRVYGRVAEKYEKRGRRYVVTETLSIDEDGVELLRARESKALP